MVDKNGGFYGNDELYDAFMEPISTSYKKSAKEIFDMYYNILINYKDTTGILRNFSCLFYGIMGDLGPGLKFAEVPFNALSFGRALSFSWLASQNKTFGIDDNVFYQGLRDLRSQKKEVHIIIGSNERMVDPQDVKKIEEMIGRKVIRTIGGHSSINNKIRFRDILDSKVR